MKKLKVVQIGTGHDHAHVALKCLLSLPDVFEVVGYVQIDTNAMSKRNLGYPWFNSVKRLTLDEAFGIKDLDCAVIETDDLLLTKYTKLALERGLHVHMDKPGGQDHKEFCETVDFAKDKDLVFHTGYMYRYNPAIKKTVEMVKSGELGEIYSIETQMSCYLDENKRAWLKDFKGGMLNFLGCHLIDVVMQMKGVPNEIVPLSAISRQDLGGEDVGLAVLKYDNCTAVIKSNGMETGGPLRRKIVVTGEKGTIEINPIEYPKNGYGTAIFTDMRTTFTKDDDWNIRPEPTTYGPFDRYEEMFSEFAQIIRKEIEPKYTYEYEKLLHEILIKACGIDDKKEEKMKAIVINKDKSLSYTDVSTPKLKQGEVLIEVYASALNRADLLQREGNYPPPAGCPEWPGLEVSGVIKEIAQGVKRWKVGDKVCALLGGGGYAEYVSVPEGMVMPIPNGLSFVEAAAIPEVYMTAYLNLFHIGDAKKGETLLFTGANSGLASAVIPMAKAFGLRVITTVRGQDKKEKVSYLNADRVVDTTTEDIAEVLKEEEQKGHPVNVVIDCLAGDRVNDCLNYVARGCRWIQIASLAGDKCEVDFRNLFVKNIRIIGSTLRSKTPEDKAKLLSELVDKTWKKFENGEMKVKIYKTFPIEQADDAQQVLYRGENVGKVVLIVKN